MFGGVWRRSNKEDLNFRDPIECCLISNNDSKYLNTLAGIIWLSGAASIKLCHEFVLPGMTNPKSKYHSL
jgi:hypothetical protein